MLTDVRYVKRYRMERDLLLPIARAPTPEGVSFVSWSPAQVAAHAEAKFRSFVGQPDADLFVCLGDRRECEDLMAEIAKRRGFLPSATWLASVDGEPAGTIQGCREGFRRGAIQNLGVAPEHRRRGIAAALVQRAILGFRQAGLRWAILEVTAENVAALRLYRRLGFRRTQTVFRAAERRSDACPDGR
jgi:hypothetical protein